VNERLRRLIEERQKLWAEMRGIITAAEADGGRDLSAEERQRYDALEADLDSKGNEIERCQRDAENERRLATPLRELRMLPGHDDPRTAREARRNRGELTQEEEYREAYLGYLRGGMLALDPEQRAILQGGFRQHDAEGRALTTQTGSSGGYSIPTNLYNALTVARLQFSSVRQSRARVIPTTTGAPLNIPAMNDTGNKGVLLAENTQMANQDIALTTRQLLAYLFHSKNVLVPWQLLQDSEFDIEALLGNAFGERLGRIENDYFTTGTGSSQPQGVVTGATAGATAGSTTQVAYADLVALFYQVDPAYRVMGEWMMNDTVIKQVRLLEDDNGRPLWLPADSGSARTASPTRSSARR
jgi:HK97 family phage major capsid protein